MQVIKVLHTQFRVKKFSRIETEFEALTFMLTVTLCNPGSLSGETVSLARGSETRSNRGYSVTMEAWFLYGHITPRTPQQWRLKEGLRQVPPRDQDCTEWRDGLNATENCKFTQQRQQTVK